MSNTYINIKRLYDSKCIIITLKNIHFEIQQALFLGDENVYIYI